MPTPDRGGVDRPEPALGAERVQTLAELGALLCRLRRRHARRHQTRQLSIRDLARRSGYAYGLISDYLSGKAFPPTDRFDVLVQLLGADPAEQRMLATTRDRVEDEQRRARRPNHRVPRELPPPTPGFTGRRAELAGLDRLGTERPAPRVVVVTGTAGVGKTALVVHWAQRLQARFPDGCCYVDLRGYAPDRPMPPAEVLAGLLRSLRVPGSAIPPGEAERAARFRTLLAHRRVLLVLDNARDSDQVRPLLPGGSGCTTVVTSRDALTGLVVRHGADRISLRPLSTEEAVGLLAELLGGRVAAEPVAAVQLAEQCAGLPLPLRLAAELAAARPEADLATLAAELADARLRLSRLEAAARDEPGAACRAAFSWSYRSLPDRTARAFRLVGLYPGHDLDGYALAALAGTDLVAAQSWLRDLVRAHLVVAVRPHRYGMHDLLRGYAAELAAAEPEPVRAAALTRLRDQHRYLAATAMDLVAPRDPPRRAAVPEPGCPVPQLTDPQAATGWLDAERANLVTTAVAGTGPADPGYAAELAALLGHYLDHGGHQHDYAQLLRYAGAASDPAVRADVLARLSIVGWRQHRYLEAAGHGQRALSLARGAGDRAGQARALTALGLVHWHLGRPADALDCGGQALALYQELDDRIGQARVLGNLGNLHNELGDRANALGYGRQALDLFRAAGEQTGVAIELGNLGHLLAEQGELPEAQAHLQQALILARTHGHRYLEIATLDNLGIVHRRAGQLAEADGFHRQALELAREVGDRTAEGQALSLLGALYEARGQFTTAADHHHRALRTARQVGDVHLAVEARCRLGDTLLAAGRPKRALRAYRRAFAVAGTNRNREEEAHARRGIAHALAALAARPG